MDSFMPQLEQMTAAECHRVGCLLLEKRQVSSAAEYFERALMLGLDPIEGVAERWKTWMLLGQLERAWQETDKIEGRRRRGVPCEGQLVWDGRDFTSLTVLLRNNHGLGDTIQFIRYVPLLKQRCRRLVVSARPILIPLLQTFEGIDDVVSAGESHPAFDVEMESTELPYVFRTGLATIPSLIPYISIDGRTGTAAPLPQNGTVNLGLAWASGPWNTDRSLCLTDLRPLSRIPELLVHSLQWGPHWNEALNTSHGFRFVNSSTPIPEDLMETAARICHCDLVITVDTMIAHLAGALGKRVWVLLHFDSNWRWMLDRSDSPWYPTMKLFRQRSCGDWSGPVDDIVRELQQL